MRSTPAVRIITFTVFIAFVAVFVAYRAGAFQNMFETGDYLSDVHIENSSIAVDTPGVKKDSLPAFEIREDMISSSKSMVIYHPPKQDTIKRDTQKTAEKKPMMGGSKSAIIFEPQPVKKKGSGNDTTNKKTNEKPKN